MGERQIPFTAPMVRALLAGTKTQTRRLSGLPTIEEIPGFGWHVHNRHGGVMNVEARNVGEVATEMLPIQPGDRLWVREAWRSEAAYDDLSPSQMGGEEPIQYQADEAHQTWGYPAMLRVGRFRPGVFMPRWASRLTLAVTDVRVERLQDINEADAGAEGVKTWVTALAGDPKVSVADVEAMISRTGEGSMRAGYAALWEAINGPGSWEANPWIAAYTFMVKHQNIDAGDVE